MTDLPSSTALYEAHIEALQATVAELQATLASNSFVREAQARESRLIDQLEAAEATIDTLRRENERLREALSTLLTALDAPTALHPKFGAQWMGPAINIAKAVHARTEPK